MRIILLSLLISSVMLCQEILTLEDAVKIALMNNYSIKIAASEGEISENDYSPGAAGFFPTVDASGSYSKSVNNTEQDFFDGRTINRESAKSTNLNASIALSWTIFDGLRMFASYDRLKELRKTGELNLRNEIEIITSDVERTYYDIVRQNKVMSVIDRNLNLSEERVRIAEAEKEIGTASRSELLQAQVDLNEDRSNYLREEIRLNQLKVTLNRLLGRQIDTPFNITDSITVDASLEYETLLKQLEDSNVEILLAQQTRNISDIDLSIIRSSLYPELNFTTSYNFLRSDSEAGLIKTNNNYGFNYGITASLNLFNGFNTRRQIENAQILIEISELESNDIYSRLSSDLLNLFNTYKSNLELIELETANLKVAEQNADIALERMKLGSITPLEFREAQIDLLNAESRLVGAKFEAKFTEIELSRISGQLRIY